MKPTRKQKRTWRRRVSRAIYGSNTMRGATSSIHGGIILLFQGEPWKHPWTRIVAPWLRGER